jgi:DNA-binding NarL/FixJ family response regulator
MVVHLPEPAHLDVKNAETIPYLTLEISLFRLFPDLTKPQTGRLNKSPHTVHAIANRHKSPQEWAGLSDLFMDQSPTLMSREEVSRINQAISSLSSRQLQCVYLRAEGFRYREIAGLLGVTMATVAESLRRPSRKLRGDEV